MNLASLARSLPPEFQIILADIGSAGGLHKRWAPLRAHVSAVLFDPLDQSTGSGRDRYFPVALARGEGRAALHVTRRVSMTSALPPNAPLLARFWDKPQHTEIEKTIDVATDSLDHVVAANGIDLDVMKIDVQGGEYDILAGARSAMTKSVFLAEIEVSFLERYKGLRTFDHVVQLMRDYGFDLIDVSRLKRYRYQNTSGVVNPGLGLGDRAGRLAFCDAIFLLRDETLSDRLSSGDGRLALKAILTLLVYGKADMAAAIFDAAGGRIDGPVRERISAFLQGLKGRRRIGPSGLHRALDYLARKV